MNEFEIEREQTRSQVAAYLRQLADGLENGDKVTFVIGDESTTINPPGDVHFRLETHADSSWLGDGDGQSLILELGWEGTEVDDDDELTIVKQPNERVARNRGDHGDVAAASEGER